MIERFSEREIVPVVFKLYRSALFLVLWKGQVSRTSLKACTNCLIRSEWATTTMWLWNRVIRKQKLTRKWSNWAATASLIGSGASSEDVKGEPGWMLSLISCVCFLFSVLYQLQARNYRGNCAIGYCCVREWDRAIGRRSAVDWPCRSATLRPDSARTHIIIIWFIACRKETMKPLIIHTIIDTAYRATILPGILSSLYLAGL